MKRQLLLAAILLIPLPFHAAHPAVLLTPEVVAFLRTKQAAGDADWLELKRSADRYLALEVAPYHRTTCPRNSICYSYQGSGWLTAIRALGIAYQVTGDARYARQIIAIMDAANAPFKNTGSVEPQTVDSGYPSRSAALGLALAFDWVYDQLDGTRKADTINTLNAWFDWVKASAFQRAGPAYGNYFGGHLLGFGAVGYATAGDNSRAAEIQNHVLGLFRNTIPTAFSSGGFAGGYPVESFNYGPAHFVYLLQYMQIVRDNTGQDLGLTRYGKLMARSLLYNLRPNRWQTTDEGNFPGDYTGILPGFFPLTLASVLKGSVEGRWMQYLYTNLAEPSSGLRVQSPDTYSKLLHWDASRPSLDYRTTEPLWYRSLGDEHLYVRSDWTDGAVWASFAAGSEVWASHESKKAGHIAIQRGTDYLLVNSGQWKGATGVGGNPQAFNRSSWRTNTLFFSDLGEYMYEGPAYTGGQATYGPNSVLAQDTGTGYVYSKADLTQAYDRSPGERNPNTRSLRSFIRSFVFLGDKYFVVWDRVTALKATYEKKIFWHVNPTGGAPTLSGSLAQSTIGNSRLSIKTLLPTAPVLHVAADGVRDFTDPTTGTYRVEVSDSIPGTNFNALHVIEAAAREESFPNASTIEVTGGNMVGALIADAIPRAVLFSEDGTPQSNVAYRVSHPATGRHVIADLVPGAYEVKRDGVTILQTRSTTAAGVLAFETTDGDISVSRQATVAATVTKVAGDLQVASTGTALPSPLVVRVTDGNSSPVAGIGINFLLTGGRATLSDSTVTTDENGLASVAVSFQNVPGPVTVLAENLGLAGNQVTFLLAAVNADSGSADPQISDVVDGSSFASYALTAGSIVSLFGSNLASRITSAETLPLPAVLGGVTVQASGFNAPLLFVSPSQLNFQLPWELSELSQATVTVTADGATSQPRSVPLAPFSPGLVALNSGGSGQGAILITQSGEVAAPPGSVPGRASRPARQGEFVSVYCSGLGLVSNTPPTGIAAGNSPLATTSRTPTVSIGGRSAQVTPGFFSGLAPGYLGLYQVNVQIPPDAPSGDAVPVTLDIDGTTSNAVTIAVD